jgi:hypothetical protein
MMFGQWNVYISPLSGLPMYVRREDDPCDGARHNAAECTLCNSGIWYACTEREKASAQFQYWGRVKYRLNVKPKARLVHYSFEGEHEGPAYIHYIPPERLKAMWGVIQ